MTVSSAYIVIVAVCMVSSQALSNLRYFFRSTEKKLLDFQQQLPDPRSTGEGSLLFPTREYTSQNGRKRQHKCPFPANTMQPATAARASGRYTPRRLGAVSLRPECRPCGLRPQRPRETSGNATHNPPMFSTGRCATGNTNTAKIGFAYILWHGIDSIATQQACVCVCVMLCANQYEGIHQHGRNWVRIHPLTRH